VCGTEAVAWRKLGRVFVPDGSRPWARAYASFPTVEVLSAERLRIYFTALDEHKNGRTGYVDVNAGNPLKLAELSTEPVLDVGRAGDFDDSGANAFSVLTRGRETLMYYQGWQHTTKAPYLIFTGLARSEDNGATFRKHSPVPILDRTREEPYMRAAPFVMQDNGALSMWYVSCTQWAMREGAMRYHVVIRTARSDDGITWEPHTEPCLEPAGPREYAVGRPCVLRENGRYRMWYSIRSFDRPYRIGYAESLDGLTWERMDHLAGIEPSESGWDAEMVCYPYVVQAGSHRYLFYNGNRHGATGFGVAEWEG
jgi:hypothetical protein